MNVEKLRRIIFLKTSQGVHHHFVKVNFLKNTFKLLYAKRKGHFSGLAHIRSN